MPIARWRARPAGRAANLFDVSARLRRDAPPEMTDKPALRARLRAARAVAFRHPIAPTPGYLALLRPGAVVASYVATGSEADPTGFAQAARAAGCPIALPHIVDRATPLRFLLEF